MGLLTFEVVGGQDSLKGLVALGDAIKDLRPFWRDVFAPKYFGMVQDLFATGGRARGGNGRFKSGAWAPLSTKYAAWKRVAYPGRPLLVREGTLRESVTWHSGAGLGAGGFFDARRDSVVAGTTVAHGKYHMDGSKRMPARPFLPTPDPAVFAPLMQRWIIRAARKS